MVKEPPQYITPVVSKFPCHLGTDIYIHLYVYAETNTRIYANTRNIRSKMSSQAPTYSPDQLEQYLQRIRYGTGSDPVHPRLSRLQQSIHNNPFNVLSELQRRHLCSIQWGNSSLHYSQHHSISVHPVAIFEKLVSRGLDGYCMETTSLFYGVLRSLGYQVYPTAGRVSQQVSTGLDNGLYLHLYVVFFFSYPFFGSNLTSWIEAIWY